ncbi:tRNA nucleotidyltransferase/poly(A) polymerase [Peptoniphilus sp. ING2-D1G]|nr:tRNA nucleotidyltransferase/poly(A) polymerase [Peptoniphilus sp. ING2-D1G]
MPKEILEILEIFKKFNHKAYLVGGALRDYLLGKKPHDFDVATDATPDEVCIIFEGNILHEAGREFGTIAIEYKGYEVEIATFRLEGLYRNHRKPKELVFTKNIEDDLARRDFTVNAMAMDMEGNLTDLYGGKEDLENKIIRCVGDAQERIEEDALRIIRAVRFCGTLNFNMDDELKIVIKEKGHLLKEIAKERIQVEFNGIMLSDKPSASLDLMEELGLLEILFQDLKRTVGYNQKTPYHIKTLFDHIKCVVDSTDKVLEVRLAALFHDIAKPWTLCVDESGVGHFFGHDEMGADMAKNILREYKYSNKVIDKVILLISEHMKVSGKLTDKALRRQIRRVGFENIFDLYDLLMADRACTSIDGDIGDLEYNLSRVKQILMEDKRVKEKNYLCIDGKDIIELGFKEGKIIGEILKYANELTLDNPKLNEKEILLDIINREFR